MAIPEQPCVDPHIESQILAILHQHPRLTFPGLAEAVVECRWRELVGALNRLRTREQIDLAALRWKYEVVLRRPAA